MALSTAEAAAAIAAARPADAVVISTMSALRMFPPLSPSRLNLACAPLMGGASALGLGIALARPERQVIVLDGDGSLLMQLGSLVTVAGAAPGNLYHVVFDNGVWFEGGGNVPLPAAGRTDWTGLARAAGYPAVYDFTDAGSLAAGFGAVLAGPAPCLVRLDIDPSASDREPWSAGNVQEDAPDRQFTRMGDEARELRKVLTGQPACGVGRG